jgi:hypothetical protein
MGQDDSSAVPAAGPFDRTRWSVVLAAVHSQARALGGPAGRAGSSNPRAAGPTAALPQGPHKAYTVTPTLTNTRPAGLDLLKGRSGQRWPQAFPDRRPSRQNL